MSNYRLPSSIRNKVNAEMRRLQRQAEAEARRLQRQYEAEAKREIERLKRRLR